MGYYIIAFLVVLLFFTSIDAINYYRLTHEILNMISK